VQVQLQEYILKTTYLSPLLCASLFFACVSNAQTPPTHPDTTKGNDLVGSPQPPPANPLATPATTGQDKSTGNDLVDPNKARAADQDTTKGNAVVGSPQPPPANPLATPPTTGQNKSTGNDLVGTDKSQADAPQKHPAFDTVDDGKKGYLTAHDVRNQQWVSKHFAKCDLNRDGHLTEVEYTNCHK
jgi:hypothetical protein